MLPAGPASAPALSTEQQILYHKNSTIEQPPLPQQPLFFKNSVVGEQQQQQQTAGNSLLYQNSPVFYSNKVDGYKVRLFSPREFGMLWCDT